MLTPTLPVEIRQEAAEVNSPYLYSFVTIAIRKENTTLSQVNGASIHKPYTLTLAFRMFGLIARCYL